MRDGGSRVWSCGAVGRAEPVEGGEDVVEPGDRHALVRDAAAQHDVLEFLTGVERSAGAPGPVKSRSSPAR